MFSDCKIALTFEQSFAKQMKSYNVDVTVQQVIDNSITRQIFVKLGPGTRITKLQALSSEISLLIGATQTVYIYPDFTKSLVVIETALDANHRLKQNFQQTIVQQELFDNKYVFPVLFGLNDKGQSQVVDFIDLPHLLVAGQTGSGKSVFLKSLIASVAYNATKCSSYLLLIDPKSVEFSIYNGLPSMLVDTITDSNCAAKILNWLIEQMEVRYNLLTKHKYSNITEYNQSAHKRMSYVCVVIDEFADLIMQNQDISQQITCLAQKGRAAGIHLVIATQRPSSKIIGGVIKANFPARVAFQVASALDSRIVLDKSGAESLIGKGDMLFKQGSSITRMQGVNFDNTDVQFLANHCKAA